MACTVLVHAGTNQELLVKDNAGFTPVQLGSYKGHRHVAFLLGMAIQPYQDLDSLCRGTERGKGDATFNIGAFRAIAMQQGSLTERKEENKERLIEPLLANLGESVALLNQDELLLVYDYLLNGQWQTTFSFTWYHSKILTSVQSISNDIFAHHKCDEPLEHDAYVGTTPTEVVKKCKYTIGMLSDPSASISVVFDKDGVLEQIGEGKCYIDISTVDADTSSTISESYADESVGP
ncbi:hypothetical protein IFM89_011011 [Coptis chinensis]|uniref:6-phosphogluconate dehydrogenase NADP-binding domain-containing protein n=1 Tax=Coptis chinensis TaxID=261450 RepID=A0A835MDZ5_9MAGN|nr:hypothetical protein IFM89_011011 [Coptis chinensis]